MSRLKEFEKNIISLGEHLKDLTNFSVKSDYLESNFFIKIEISMQRMIGGIFTKELRFPIVIWSRKIKNTAENKYPIVPEFFDDAIQLPGANIRIDKT